MVAAGANGQFGPGDPHPVSLGSHVGGRGEAAGPQGDPTAASPAAERPPAAVSSGSLAELRRERVQLAERVASLTWDLGGLAYEMAIRDHYRLDVLARRAAELQQADAQLGEIERLLAAAEEGVH